MEQRPRPVWGVHLVYFGLVIASSVLVYQLPDIQAILLSNVNDALERAVLTTRIGRQGLWFRQHPSRRGDDVCD